MTILSDLHFDTIFGNDLATEDHGDLVGLADRTVGVEQPLTKLIQCGPAGERSGFHNTPLARRKADADSPLLH